jgi:hypothetical protein
MVTKAVKIVTEWVDGGVIADALAENLKIRGVPASVNNMKGLWLATLESLPRMFDDVPDERIIREAQKLQVKKP